MQPFLEFGRKPVVSLHLAGEQGVTALIRCIQDIEECRAWGLLLVCDVRMPGDGVGPCFEKVLGGSIIDTAMDKMDFGVSCRSSACGMDM